MSIVLCSERGCIYQKEGQCNLNKITPSIMNKGAKSTCLYFTEKPTDLKNQEQSQQRQKGLL